jgi:hypothetical protein
MFPKEISSKNILVSTLTISSGTQQWGLWDLCQSEAYFLMPLMQYARIHPRIDFKK